MSAKKYGNMKTANHEMLVKTAPECECSVHARETESQQINKDKMWLINEKSEVDHQAKSSRQLDNQPPHFEN